MKNKWLVYFFNLVVWGLSMAIYCMFFNEHVKEEINTFIGFIIFGGILTSELGNPKE